MIGVQNKLPISIGTALVINNNISKQSQGMDNVRNG